MLDKLGTFADFDDLELNDLLNVSVSIAAGRTQTLEEAPSIVSVITDDQIRQTGVRTVAEALQLVPGIVVLTDSNGRGRIALRGVSSGITSGSSEDILVLFNGHRLNEPIQGGATIVNLDIPVENIRKIEIIRGPGSALFGANAYLGVINIVSYTAETFNGLQLSGAGGSFGTGQGSLLFGKSFEKVSLSGFLQYGKTDGAKLLIPADVQTSLDRALLPFGVPPSSRAPGLTDEHREAVDANFQIAYQGLTINGRVTDQDAGGYIGFIDNLTNRNRERTNQLALDGGYRWSIGRNGDLRAALTYTRTAQSQLFDVQAPGFVLVFPDGRLASFPDGLFTDGTFKARQVGGEVVFNQQVVRGNTIAAGLSVNDDATFDVSSRGNFDVATLIPSMGLVPQPPLASGSRTVTGLFVQDTWNPTPLVGITGGLRYDHYSDFGNAFTPRAGVVWRLPRNLNLKVLYGRAFRAPSFAELSIISGGFVGNPALRPATINTFETAIGYRRKDLRISANVYANFLRNLIVTERPLSRTEATTFVNSAAIDATGFELEAKRFFGLRHWLQASYAYQHSNDQGTSLPVPDIPAHLANLSGTVGLGKYVRVTPMLLFRGDLPRVSFDPRPPVDHYTLANLNLQAHDIAHMLDVSFVIDNLTDQAYVDPAPFNGVPGDYPRPGRRFLLKATWRLQ